MKKNSAYIKYKPGKEIKVKNPSAWARNLIEREQKFHWRERHNYFWLFLLLGLIILKSLFYLTIVGLKFGMIIQLIFGLFKFFKKVF